MPFGDILTEHLVQVSWGGGERGSLPTSHTCFNMIVLPDAENYQQLEKVTGKKNEKQNYVKQEKGSIGCKDHWPNGHETSSEGIIMDPAQSTGLVRINSNDCSS